MSTLLKLLFDAEQFPRVLDFLWSRANSDSIPSSCERIVPSNPCFQKGLNTCCRNLQLNMGMFQRLLILLHHQFRIMYRGPLILARHDEVNPARTGGFLNNVSLRSDDGLIRIFIAKRPVSRHSAATASHNWLRCA